MDVVVVRFVFRLALCFAIYIHPLYHTRRVRVRIFIVILIVGNINTLVRNALGAAA
jgi:hypothetical protein